MSFPNRVDSFLVWSKNMVNAAQVPRDGRPGKSSMAPRRRLRKRKSRRKLRLKRKKNATQD